MLDNLGGWEILVLILVALFVIGPERLPKVLSGIRDGITKIRRMASNATADISKEVGTDINITDLHPKTFIRKHVLSEEDEAALRSPLKSTLNDVKQHAKPLQDELDETAKAVRSRPSRSRPSKSSKNNGDSDVKADASANDDASDSTAKGSSFDTDAT